MPTTKFGTPEPTISNAVKLHKKGQKFAGIIVELPEDKTPYPAYGNPGEMAKWPDGTLKKQWVFTMKAIKEDICDCEEWCEEGAKNSTRGTEEDDGYRKLYVPSSGNLITAMYEALKKAEVQNPEEGGVFVIQRTGLDFERAKKTGGKPPVLYNAAYKAPTADTLLEVKKYQNKDDESTSFLEDYETLQSVLED
jgi:hypothetical protein